MENTREIYCQCFNGFYESRWLSSDSLYWELQNISHESGVDLSKGEFEINREAYYKDVGKRYTKELEGLFKETLGIDNFSMEFVKVVSPREYNFMTDQIVYNLTMQDKDEKNFYDVVREKMRENYDELKQMIIERHTSRSGFSSYMSNNIDAWLNEIEFNDSRPYLACALEYLTEIRLSDYEGAKDNNIIDETIYEILSCNGLWIEDYIVGCDDESKAMLQKAIDAMC